MIAERYPKCETCDEVAVGMLLGPVTETPRRVIVLCARCGRLANEVTQRELAEKRDTL